MNSKEYQKKYGQFSHAAAELDISSSIAKTNLPINRREGKTEQADLESSAIKSYRSALDALAKAAQKGE